MRRYGTQNSLQNVRKHSQTIRRGSREIIRETFRPCKGSRVSPPDPGLGTPDTGTAHVALRRTFRDRPRSVFPRRTPVHFAHLKFYDGVKTRLTLTGR